MDNATHKQVVLGVRREYPEYWIECSVVKNPDSIPST